ncbi:MAG: sulfotransferase [Acidobacteria bacterium]|nr:sulfotransferase [Acidobacteriota bacterium]
MGVQLRFGIGGIGGSGTRLVSRMVQELDFNASNDQNESLDDLLFTTLFKSLEVFNPEFHLAEKYRLFCHCREKTAGLEWDESQVLDWLGQNDWASEQWIAERLRLASIAENQRPWFWKEPNTHVIIERLLSLDPHLKYIHVVRNAFDMALSQNQNQIRFWGEALFGRKFEETVQDRIDFWCRVQRRILAIRDEFPERVLFVTYDLLVDQFEIEIQKIARFVGKSDQNLGYLKKLIRPASTGRGNIIDRGSFCDANLETLKEFGFY